jgi:hypothetical protein
LGSAVSMIAYMGQSGATGTAKVGQGGVNRAGAVGGHVRGGGGVILKALTNFVATAHANMKSSCVQVLMRHPGHDEAHIMQSAVSRQTECMRLLLVQRRRAQEPARSVSWHVKAA